MAQGPNLSMQDLSFDDRELQFDLKDSVGDDVHHYHIKTTNCIQFITIEDIYHMMKRVRRGTTMLGTVFLGN